MNSSKKGLDLRRLLKNGASRVGSPSEYREPTPVVAVATLPVHIKHRLCRTTEEGGAR